MYWERFEELYDAFALRQATEDLMEVRNSMLAGMYANPNLDDTKEQRGVRQQAVTSLFEAFDDQVEQMRNPTPDIDKENPFFAAMRVPEAIDTSKEAMVEAFTQVRNEYEVDQL